MKSIKAIISISISIFFVSSISGQDCNMNKPKSFESKLLRNKTIWIPTIDQIPKRLIDRTSFREFNTNSKVATEYIKRWNEGIKASSFDYTTHEVRKFNWQEEKKAKSKGVIIMYFEKDYCQNNYAYLAFTEPKFVIIGNAVVNDLDFSKVEDIKMLMNMFAYSVTASSGYFDYRSKPLYRGHEMTYRKNMEEFAKNEKTNSFLVPKFDRKIKNYKKSNDKINEYLKTSWDLSTYVSLSQSDINARIAEVNPSDYYIRIFPIYTSNDKLQYQYYAILTASNNDMIYGSVGGRELKTGNLKNFQEYIGDWLYFFKDPKTRDIVPESEKSKDKK